MTTADDRAEMVRRLLVMQESLTAASDAIDAQAEIAKAFGATGCATAAYFLREAVIVYGDKLREFVADYIAGEYDE
jgi:hypothetical protein